MPVANLNNASGAYVQPTSVNVATALEDAARTTFAGNTRLLPWWGGAAMLVVYGVVLSFVGTLTTLRCT